MKARFLRGTASIIPEQHSLCLYTVSLNPQAPRRQQIIDGFCWLRDRYPNVRPIIGDGPLIDRTAVITGVCQRDVDRLSAEFRESFEDPIMVSALATTADFQSAMTEVLDAHRRAPGLAESVATDAASFVNRAAKKGNLVTGRKQALLLSEEYVLVEIAIYLCLARRGYLIDAYLGQELPVLRKFISGELTGCLSPLERRVFVNLVLEDS